MRRPGTNKRQTPAQEVIDEIYTNLPPEYREPLNYRISPTEAIIMNSRHCRTVNAKINRQLKEAVNSGCFSTILGFTLPRDIFVNDTLGILTSLSSPVELYTTFLPQLKEKALKDRILGKIFDMTHSTAASSSSPADPTTMYTSGDPKLVSLSLRQASNLMHMFYMLPFICNNYHDNIGSETIINDTFLLGYQDLAKQIDEVFNSDDNDPNAPTLVDVLKLNDGNGSLPLSPFFIEEIVSDSDKKTVIALRFVVCMSVHLRKDLQEEFNRYLKELRNRLVYNSECMKKVLDLCSPKNTNASTEPQPVAAANAGRGGGGGGRQQQQIDPSLLGPHGKKMHRLTKENPTDNRGNSQKLIQSLFRTWETPLIHATYDAEQSSLDPSTVLAQQVKSILTSGDNILVPLPIKDNTNNNNRTLRDGDSMEVDADIDEGEDGDATGFQIGASRRDGSGRYVSAFASLSGLNGLQQTHRQSNRSAMAAAAAAAEGRAKTEGFTFQALDKFSQTNSHLVSRPKLFNECYYLPSADLSSASILRGPPDPNDNIDPRRLEHLFHMLNSFSSFACTSANQEQLNPFAYFEIDVGGAAFRPRLGQLKPEKVPPYMFSNPPQPQHAKWHSRRDNHDWISYGGLLSFLPEAYDLAYADFWRTFKGFPANVIQKGLVTLVMPTLQPWEVDMLPLPEIIRNDNARLSVAKLIRPMISKEESTYNQYIQELGQNEDLKFALASFYLMNWISGETVLVDAKRWAIEVSYEPLSTEVSPYQRNNDLKNDIVSIPGSNMQLCSSFNNINKFLNIRLKCARFNITMMNNVPTRIAWETGQPFVKQPGDPDYGETTTTALDVEEMKRGLDVFHFAQERTNTRSRVIKEMSSSVIESSTSSTNYTETMAREGTNKLAEREEASRPRRYQVFKDLTKTLEDINSRLLKRCIKIPNTGEHREYHTATFPRLRFTPTMPPWLPMSMPISSIFKDFNERNSSEKWVYINVNDYSNTSPIEEFLSHLASTGIETFKIISGVDTFIVLVTAYFSSTTYNNSAAPHLHILLSGETAASKTFLLDVVKWLAAKGTIIGSAEQSEKAHTVQTNNNGHAYILSEAPGYITLDPGKYGIGTKHAELIERFKIMTDEQVQTYLYLNSNDRSQGSSSKSSLLFKRVSLSVSLNAGVLLWATNEYLGRMQKAVYHRLLVLNPPISSDNHRGIKGSQLEDLATHHVTGYNDMKPGGFRVLHCYLTIINLFTYMNPRCTPDVYDARNLLNEILRESKPYLPKASQVTRRNGRLGLMIAELCKIDAVHSTLRDSGIYAQDLVKYAPSCTGGEPIVLRHLSIDAFLAKCIPRLRANKQHVILTLTLLKDVIESPIRSALMEFLADRCYPDGDCLKANYRKFPIEKRQKKTNKNGDVEVEVEIEELCDVNVVEWKTGCDNLSKLYVDIGQRLSCNVDYSEYQVQFVIEQMQKERVEIPKGMDGNTKEFPRKVVRLVDTENEDDQEVAMEEEQARVLANAKRTGNPTNQQTPATTQPLPDESAVRKAIEELKRLAPNVITQNYIDELMRETRQNRGNQQQQPPPPTVAPAPPIIAPRRPTRRLDNSRNGLLLRAQQLIAEDWGIADFTKKKPEVKTNFTIPLLEIEKYREGKHDYYKLSISHEKLRKHYRPNFGDRAVVYEPDPFEQSYVWKMAKTILENRSLEYYPPYITKAVLESGEIGLKGKEYFEGGKYTYLSGRTDAVHHFASPLINQAQKELDEMHGKGKVKLPTSFPLRWLMQTPQVERKGDHNLQLKCILSGSPIDSEYVNGKSIWLQEDDLDSDEEEEEDVVMFDEGGLVEQQLKLRAGLRKAKEARQARREQLKSAPRSSENYTYDLDYYPLLRRCTRLGLNIHDHWESLPMIQKIRKMDYTDKAYPESSIRQYVEIVKQDAERDLLRAAEVARGKKKHEQPKPPTKGDDAELGPAVGTDGIGVSSEKTKRPPKLPITPTSSLVRISERRIDFGEPTREKLLY